MIAHEFGHAIFDQLFFGGEQKVCVDDEVADDPLSHSRLAEEYAVSGFNEGTADFISFAVTGSANTAQELLRPELGPIEERSLLADDFVYDDLRRDDDEESDVEPACSGEFYCIGTLWARSLYRGMIALGYDAGQAADREAFTRDVLSAVAKTRAALIEQDLLPPRDGCSDMSSVENYEGLVISAFLVGIFGQPARGSAPVPVPGARRSFWPPRLHRRSAGGRRLPGGRTMKRHLDYVPNRFARALISFLAIAAALLVAPSPAPAERLSLGTAVTWQDRRDFGENTRANFVPELVGFTYLPLPTGRLYLRPGARLGYSGLSQAPMPHALQVEERDLTFAGEIGLVYDGPVVPSLTLGGGGASRWIAFNTEMPINDSNEPISRHQWLGIGYAQVGVGIPIARGFLVAEPFIRYQLSSGDDRAPWLYGVELTVQLF